MISDDPLEPIESTNDSYESLPMTRREYFAGLALQGLLGNSKVDVHINILAAAAVVAADALIEALKKQP